MYIKVRTGLLGFSREIELIGYAHLEKDVYYKELTYLIMEIG